MSKSGSNQELPTKSSALFKALVRSHHNKQYKKGLKIAEQILKNNPTHGETLSIKALILRSTGKIEEAYEMAKLAIQNAPKNCLCWKMYGYMYQDDKEYDKAISCYFYALNCDDTDFSTLKDCSALLLYRKRYKEYMEIRKNAISKGYCARYSDILELAFAAYLDGDIELGLSLLDTFEKSNNLDNIIHLNRSPNVEYPLDNTKKFKTMLLEKKGDHDSVLSLVNGYIDAAVDKVFFREAKVNALLKLNKLINAEAECWILMSHNRENIHYLKKLMASRNIQPSFGNQNQISIQKYDENSIITLFNELEKKYPKSSVIWYLPLECLEASSETFVKCCERYLRTLLAKNCPTIFYILKNLYKNKDKGIKLLNLALNYDQNFENSGSIDGVENNNTEKSKSDISPIWIKNFISLSYCYLLDFANSMKFIDKAIELCSTQSELYVTKAKIYNESGNYAEALKNMLKAQSIDTSDRYIKFETIRYALENDQLSLAESTALKLAPHNTSMEMLYTNMNNIQFMPFFYQIGIYHLNKKNYECAMTRFHGIVKQFQRYHADCIDFYYLSMQRVHTLIPFDELSQNISNLNNNPTYIYSAMHIANIYILLYDEKIDLTSSDTVNDLMKLKNNKDTATPKKDPSDLSKQPEGRHLETNFLNYTPDFPLLMEKDPLEKSSEYIHNIVSSNTNHRAIYETGYQLYLRKKKIIIVTRCLTKLKEDPFLAPKARFLATDFALKLIAPSDPLNVKNIAPDLYNLINKYLKSIISDCSLDQITVSPITNEYLSEENLKYIQSNATDPLKLFFALKCCSLLNDTENFEKFLASFGDNSIRLSNYEYTQCIEIYCLLREMSVGSDILENFKSLITKTFVFSPLLSDEPKKEPIDPPKTQEVESSLV